MIYIFNFKKKTAQANLNEYDLHLQCLLNNEFHKTNIKDIESYVTRIYFKQKSLPVYPEGPEHVAAQKRIESLQTCLLYAIADYDEWYEKVVTYIDNNLSKFDFYHGYQTGERMYPPKSYEIIDNVVRYNCIMRYGLK